MRKLIVSLISIFLVMASITVNATPSPSITWQSYSENAFNQAKKEHKLVLVFIQAEWCQWCKMMKTTYQDSDIISLVNDNFVPIKVNIDTEKEIVKKFQVVHLPTNVILDSNQTILSNMSGYFTAEQFLVKLDDVIHKR